MSANVKYLVKHKGETSEWISGNDFSKVTEMMNEKQNAGEKFWYGVKVQRFENQILVKQFTYDYNPDENRWVARK